MLSKCLIFLVLLKTLCLVVSGRFWIIGNSRSHVELSDYGTEKPISLAGCLFMPEQCGTYLNLFHLILADLILSHRIVFYLILSYPMGHHKIPHKSRSYCCGRRRLRFIFVKVMNYPSKIHGRFMNSKKTAAAVAEQFMNDCDLEVFCIHCDIIHEQIHEQAPLIINHGPW